MPRTTPRIPPIAPEAFTDEQAELVGGRDHPMNALNLTRTLVNHPALLKKWMPFAAHMGLESTLPARDREILVLRVLALCGETYEAGHHHFIARKIGLSDEEIAAAQAGHGGFPAFERHLIAAADELVREHTLSDASWEVLAARYTPQQMMELIYTAGMYMVLSLVTNSLAIQPEAEVEAAWKPI